MDLQEFWNGKRFRGDEVQDCSVFGKAGADGSVAIQRGNGEGESYDV